MQSFSDRLAAQIREKKTPVLVGLDPRWAQIPETLRSGKSEDDPRNVASVFEEFCKKVVDVVAPLVPAVKPQSAFFEQYGPAGMQALVNVVRYASEKGLLVILDAKRNDIGSTATAYAKGLIGPRCTSPWGADALTVSPYLGSDSLAPFVDVANARGGGLFILIKTSNKGGAQFQDLLVDGKPLYRHVGEYVQELAQESVEKTSIQCGYGNIGGVVGATWPEQLAELRAALPKIWFLVPGYGSQGGGAKDVAGAFDANGLGAIVNNSRGILFAYKADAYKDRFGEANWEGAVEASTRDMIDALAAETSVGRL
ncbi:MAG: orotidine-5'-phosphate decarboxylase [Thermoguttaceae bacterium]|jgi:orotidine-5'-phosphate decarboxylase